MSPQPAAPAASPPRPTIVVTGVASGLGSAFFEHYAAHSSAAHRVVGIDKQPRTDGTGPDGSTCLHNIELDVTRPTKELQKSLAVEIDQSDPVVLVLHCAGVRGLVPEVPIKTSDDVASAETLEAMDSATLLRTYEINVVGTFNILTALLPNLKLAAAQKLNPKVVVLSSRMGSIATNDKGGGYAYRASKAALNAVIRSMSVDVPEVHFSMVHPGRVETGLVCVKEDGAISPAQSLEDLLPLFERFGVDGGFASACFVDRFGAVLPW